MYVAFNNNFRFFFNNNFRIFFFKFQNTLGESNKTKLSFYQNCTCTKQFMV